MQIVSSITGPLTQHEDIENWWSGKPVAVPFFEGAELPVTFVVDTDEVTEYVGAGDVALGTFLGLTTADRGEAAQAAYENCVEFLEAVEYDEADEALHKITGADEIWPFITPDEIFLQRDEGVMYVMVTCECAWEAEHGLQFVFESGLTLTRVGEQDGSPV